MQWNHRNMNMYSFCSFIFIKHEVRQRTHLKGSKWRSERQWRPLIHYMWKIRDWWLALIGGLNWEVEHGIHVWFLVQLGHVWGVHFLHWSHFVKMGAVEAVEVQVVPTWNINLFHSSLLTSEYLWDYFPVTLIIICVKLIYNITDILRLDVVTWVGWGWTQKGQSGNQLHVCPF